MSHAALRRQSSKHHSEKLHRMSGGRANDEAQDKRMVERAISQHESHDHAGEPKTKLKLKTGGRAEGGPAKMRLDRPGRKKGGRTKGGGHTKVNVIIAPQGGGAPGAGAGPAMMPPPHPPVVLPPGPPPGGPPVMPPRPPMGPPVGAGAPMGMPHKAGGRVGRKDGGKVESIIDDGAGSGEGRLEKIRAYGKKPTGEDIPAVRKGAR
jgi:hypothetical protein